MSKYHWGVTSLGRLSTCHPILQELFRRVLERDDLQRDLTVVCGHRSKDAQIAAFQSGNSKVSWPNSKHNRVPSLAVDVAPLLAGGGVSWDWEDYNLIAPCVKDEWEKMTEEGRTEGWTLSWGGDWKKFKDGPHWELREVKKSS